MITLPECNTLETGVDQGWLTVRLDRPEARNALTGEMVDELRAVLRAVRDDRAVRGITLRGNGGVFCAGGDIKGFKSIFQGQSLSLEDVAAANRAGGMLFAELNSAPQVVVMLIEGAAVAGGLGIACAGDIVIVTEDAKFAITETTLGIPPAQIAPLLVARLGLATARRLALTAARLSGAEALEIGLADAVVSDASGLDRAEAQIRDSVRMAAPGAIAETKRLLLAAAAIERDAIIDIAADSFARCMLSDEGREGVAAFLEKRKPRWAK